MTVAPESSNEERVYEQMLRTSRGDTITFINEPEKEELFCPVISADDHVLEPPTLFENWLPMKSLVGAPRLVDDNEGVPWWVIGDEKIPIALVNGASGRVIEEWTYAASKYEDFRRGVWDPKARVQDMDIIGAWASLCFPSVIWGFAGSRFAKLDDQALGLALVKAYNDWMLNEWCGAAPERFIPCQIPWLSDAELAAQEIYRNADRGFRCVSFTENPEPLGLPSVYDNYWDPFFRACEETETVINLHVGSSGRTNMPSSRSPNDIGVCLFPMHGFEALLEWIYARIPIRFPRIKVALSEAGVSWVPLAIERLARAHRQAASPVASWDIDDVDPNELLHRNFYFTSIEDPSAFRLLDIIGEDRVMVESDFPHYDSSWPNCQSMFKRDLRHLSVDVIRKVCFENAAAVYRWKTPPESLITQATFGQEHRESD